MFDFNIKKVGNTNVTLKHLSLELIGKKLDEKKALYDYINGS